MGNTYAFLVECPWIFSGKTVVVLAPNLKAALDWVEEYKRKHFPNCQQDVVSIACVGEVVNG